LSSPSEDIGMVKPLEVEYKPGQEFVPVIPTGYYQYPSTDYNYNILQSQPSVIQQTPYSTIPYQLPATTNVDYTNNNNNSAAPTSTADLYSSTYAMLSADGITTTQPEWAYPIPEKPAEQQQQQYPPAQTYPQQQLQLHNIYPPPQNYPDPNNTILYPYNYQVYYDQSFPSTSAEPPTDLKNRQLSTSAAISGRSAQAAFSESFRKIAKIPKNEQNTFGNGDNNDDERVMCLACKGVYTSRRSLTGHIGRNEKCREIIGRTYLDTLVSTGQSDILPDPNSLEGGISPICPNCNRFISHYKGNIRRHVNQCVKRPSKPSSSNNSSGQPSPNTVNSVAEHYAAMAPVITKDNPAYHQISPECEQDNNNILHPFDQSTCTSFNPSSTTPTSAKKTGKISAVAVQSTNPYSCSWCKFTTVYKGNMKRHLISVHNCTDEILRRISFDLERLRALAPNRPITPLAPQPEKIRGCSGRKRKCRPKNDSKYDDPKRAKLLGENEIPPTAVSDVVASFASSINNNNNNNNGILYQVDEVLVPISSLDSGISSGSSIDNEC
jgi:hypothetical protein